jgi:hypothetical protein
MIARQQKKAEIEDPKISLLSARPGERLQLDCPCGATLVGLNEDELVKVARAHLRSDHPSLVDKYSRDEILFMAYRI